MKKPHPRKNELGWYLFQGKRVRLSCRADAHWSWINLNGVDTMVSNAMLIPCPPVQTEKKNDSHV